jgi:hypothetical protein
MKNEKIKGVFSQILAEEISRFRIGLSGARLGFGKIFLAFGESHIFLLVL